MGTPVPSTRWRPPNTRRSLVWYTWTAWIRLLLIAALGASTITNLLHGSALVPALFFLFVIAFLASTEIWKLQGIHATKRERAHGEATDHTTPH